MDSVTQLQNYLSSITTYMTQSLQHATYGSQTVSIEQLQDALKAEHQAHAEQLAAKAAAAPATPAASAATPPAASTATAADPAVVPDLAAPLFSGLPPSVEFAMSDRAHQLFKRVLEADVLLASLPKDVGPEAERRQMQQLEFMETWSERAGRELEEKEREARIWQQRCTWVLQQAATRQMRTRQNGALDDSSAHAGGFVPDPTLKVPFVVKLGEDNSIRARYAPAEGGVVAWPIASHQYTKNDAMIAAGDAADVLRLELTPNGPVYAVTASIPGGGKWSIHKCNIGEVEIGHTGPHGVVVSAVPIDADGGFTLRSYDGKCTVTFKLQPRA